MNIFSKEIKYITKIILIYLSEISKVVSFSIFYVQKLHIFSLVIKYRCIDIFSRKIKYRYIDIFSREIKHRCIDIFSREMKYRCINIFSQEIKYIFKIISIYFGNISKVVFWKIFYVQKRHIFSQEIKDRNIDIFSREIKYRCIDIFSTEIKYRCIDIFSRVIKY